VNVETGVVILILQRWRTISSRVPKKKREEQGSGKGSQFLSVNLALCRLVILE